VLTQERQVKKLTLADAPAGLETVTTVKIPKAFNPRKPDARRDLVSSMRNALGALADDVPSAHSTSTPAGRRAGSAARGGKSLAGRRSDASTDAELARLRKALKAHPCHACPERDDHARWAERWNKLKREHDQLVRRVEGRTGSIARTFDRTLDVLLTLGYLQRTGPDGAGRDAGAPDGAVQGPGRIRVTDDGRWLRRLYAENDLLLAECLRRGVWDGLDAAGLAAVVSTVVYQGRRDDAPDPYIPGGPTGRLAGVLDDTQRVWSEVDDLEEAHGIEATGPLDLGLVGAMYRWASGKGLDSVLRGSDLAAGDFVRWCKQVIDVLDQLGGAAPSDKLRTTARKAQDAVLRGVVAYSSL
jgi:ATP-dependent RNA helicase HelY